MKYNIFILQFIIVQFLLILLCTNSLFSQGQIEDFRLPDNYNENTIGLKLNSNGYGIDYKFSQRVTHRLRRYYEAEYSIVKSPKEIKVVNPNFDQLSIRRFVFGKTHYVNSLKLGAGLERMLFDKRDKNSISIHLTSSAGGAFAISKPIYYEIVDSIRNNVYYASYRQVDAQMQNNPTDIVGRAPFRYGLNEISIHPGIYGKASLSFDFSTEPLKTNVLEVGFAFDYYFRSFEIMAGTQHNYLFNVFIAYRFGSKYDARLHRDARRDLRSRD